MAAQVGEAAVAGRKRPQLVRALALSEVFQKVLPAVTTFHEPTLDLLLSCSCHKK